MRTELITETARTHDLIAAVDFARRARGSSPFVGIANGRGTMMFSRQRLKATLKGLEIVSAEVGPFVSEMSRLSSERALIVQARSADGKVKARRVFIPDVLWKQSPLLTSWQRAKRRKMGRCDCYEFERTGTCTHVQPKVKLTPHERAIKKLRKEMLREWRPSNPAVACEGTEVSADHRREWHLWYLQKPTRRAVMRLALRTGWKHSHRIQVKANLNSTKLYAELEKLSSVWYNMTNHQAYFNSADLDVKVKPEYALGSSPLRAKKWGEFTEYQRRSANLGNLWDYIARLWEFCGLVKRPRRDRTEPSWGAERYLPWLRDLWERRMIEEQIKAIEAEAAAHVKPSKLKLTSHVDDFDVADDGTVTNKAERG